MVGDVGDVDTARAAAEIARTRFGRLDVLVNVAGFGPPMPLVDLTKDVWDATIDSCLTGAYLMTRAALPLLLDAGTGAIVNVSSIAGKGAEANRTAYCAAKWGLRGLLAGAAGGAERHPGARPRAQPGQRGDELVARHG